MPACSAQVEGAQGGAPVQGWGEEGGLLLFDFEEDAGEQAGELAFGIGLAVAEGGAFGIGPHAAPVGGDDDKAAMVFQEAPGFAQGAAGVVGLLQAVDEQDAVEAEIGEGQGVFLRGAGEAGAAERPGGGAHLLGGDGDGATRLFAPELQIGAGIAEAEDGHAGAIGPPGEQFLPQ